MIIRNVEEKDLRASAECAVQSFGGEITADDMTMPPYEILAAFEDDDKTLTSRIEINDFTCFYGKGKLRCAGVGGVATLPQYRHKGTVRALFNKLFESDYDISILHPFSTSYYRKFGYETSADFISLETGTDNLAFIPYADRVKCVGESDIGELLEVYNRLASRYNLAYERKDGRFFNLKPFDTPDYTYLSLDESGRPDGMVSFSVKRSEETLEVSEIYFEDKKAMLNLLGYLRQYEGNLSLIRFTMLPLSSPITGYLVNEGKAKRQLQNTGAVRIINLKNVLGKAELPPGKGGFTFRVNDTVKQNSGTFSLKYENGACTLTDFDGEPDFITESNAMSKIFLCGISPDDAPYLNGLEIIHNNPDLYKAFPRKNTFFCGGF